MTGDRFLLRSWREKALQARLACAAAVLMAQHLQGKVLQATNEVFAAYREGTFGNFKAMVYRLKDAASAHADIAARRKFGPMILVP